MMGLTPKQAECLDVIKRLTKGGVSPTYAQLMSELGLSSKQGVHRLIVALEERGYISRIPYRRQSISVIRSKASPHGGDMPASYTNWSTEMLRTAYREIEAEMVRRAVS